MLELLIFSAIAAILIFTYLREMLNHQRALRKIPIRVHVNGTRGKSSLTRLISAGLRGGGMRTLAKTTGSSARIILPSGEEIPIHRFGKANIIEQISIIQKAADENVEALVIECMALEPKLQKLSESRLIQSTHGVITNVRADHLEIMGPNEKDVARALSSTIPMRGVLFTAERDHLEFLSDVASQRACRLVAPCPVQDRVDQRDLAPFGYVEHAENVCLALAVCRNLGVDRTRALEAMWNCQADVGAMKYYRLRRGSHSLVFANAFAANDPISSEQLWNLALKRHFEMQYRVVMVNCRADRSARSEQLAEAICKWHNVDLFLVVGQHTHLFAKMGRSLGVPSSKIEVAEGRCALDIIGKIETLANPQTLIVGVGNIAGVGIELLDLLNEKWEFAS